MKIEIDLYINPDSGITPGMDTAISSIAGDGGENSDIGYEIIWDKAETTRIHDNNNKKTGLRFTLKNASIKTYGDISNDYEDIVINSWKDIKEYLEETAVFHVYIRSDDFTKESFIHGLCSAEICFMPDNGRKTASSGFTPVCAVEYDGDITYSEEYHLQQEMEQDAWEDMQEEL